MFFVKKLLIVFLVIFITVPVLASQLFLTKTSDVPLMEGLKVSATNQMDFDTPSGQVLSLEGMSKTKTGDDILKFYESILPQMGWVLKEKGVFERQNDSLNIVILKNKKPSKIRFDIFLTQEH